MKGLVTFNLVLGVILASCNDNQSSLIGSWKLVADQQIDSTGNVVNQDIDVSGLLIYTAEGDMSVQLLWHQRRKPLLSDSIMKNDGNSTGVGLGYNSWTPEQNRTWIDTYEAYFGEYDVDWDNAIVTHKINGNLRPEEKRKEYRRRFTLKGDTLFLRGVESKDTWQVLWTKMNHNSVE